MHQVLSLSYLHITFFYVKTSSSDLSTYQTFQTLVDKINQYVIYKHNFLSLWRFAPDTNNMILNIKFK